MGIAPPICVNFGIKGCQKIWEGVPVVKIGVHLFGGKNGLPLNAQFAGP